MIFNYLKKLFNITLMIFNYFNECAYFQQCRTRVCAVENVVEVKACRPGIGKEAKICIIVYIYIYIHI